MDKETAYKFMAYFIELGDYYDNIDELKHMIEVSGWSIDDFTEEELNNILKYSEKIIF